MFTVTGPIKETVFIQLYDVHCPDNNDNKGFLVTIRNMLKHRTSKWSSEHNWPGAWLYGDELAQLIQYGNKKVKKYFRQLWLSFYNWMESCALAWHCKIRIEIRLIFLSFTFEPSDRVIYDFRDLFVIPAASCCKSMWFVISRT